MGEENFPFPISDNDLFDLSVYRLFHSVFPRQRMLSHWAVDTCAASIFCGRELLRTFRTNSIAQLTRMVAPKRRLFQRSRGTLLLLYSGRDTQQTRVILPSTVLPSILRSWEVRLRYRNEALREETET